MNGDGSTSVIRLQCVATTGYCPPLSDSQADHLPITGLWGAGGSPTHRVIATTVQVPVSWGILYEEAISTCPNSFYRISGDGRVVCSHGLDGRGVWKPQGGLTTNIVDTSFAKVLSCQLDTIYGVQRLYYVSANKPSGMPGSSGQDVVPQIDQNDSEFDAAHFKAHLKLDVVGLAQFSVEVLGQFVFTFNGSILLKGRTTASSPQTFVAETLSLVAGFFYQMSLQYNLDPELTAGDGSDVIPRRLRLFWSLNGSTPEVVPRTAFYHGYEPIPGAPFSVEPISDPSPCVVGPVVTTRLRIGDVGNIVSGSLTHAYNGNMNCAWRLVANQKVRFILNVNLFDIERSTGCTNDYLAVWGGIGQTMDLIDRFCGQRSPGTVLTEAVGTDALLEFVSNSDTEGMGFDISYLVAAD